MKTFCSLLSSKEYLLGIIGLNYSLIKVQSIYPFLVLITENVIDKEISEELNKRNIHYRIIPNYTFQKSNQRYASTLNKFFVYNLIEYEKIIFIDADAFLIENIDALFELEPPAGYKYFNGEKNIISGGLFLIQPNPIYYQKALKIAQESEFLIDDEPLLELFFENNFNEIKVEYFHLGTIPKYWYYCKNLNEVFQFIDSIIYYPKNTYEIFQKLKIDF